MGILRINSELIGSIQEGPEVPFGIGKEDDTLECSCSQKSKTNISF